MTPRALLGVVLFMACGRTDPYEPAPTPSLPAPDAGAPFDAGGPACRPECGPNSVCADGFCSCNPGFVDCNGVRADGCEAQLDRDPQNCGACGAACGAALNVCTAGKCATATWVELTPMRSPPGRSFFPSAFDSTRQRGVIFGGQSSANTMLRDTWEWNGTTWLQVMTADAPPARRAASMVYDEGRGVVVLFGGSVSTSECGPDVRNDTWEYNGTAWRRVTPARSPAARTEPILVYDGARRVVVMFGGSTCSLSCPSETWEYDGTTWSQRSPPRSPPARCDWSGAYDVRRQRFVVFGGGGSAGPVNDTWEFDGATWVERTQPASPPARFNLALTWSPARGAVVLYGGRAATDFGDTWEWDGSRWNDVVTQQRPPPRSGHTLFTDALGRAVMFGGWSGIAETWRYEVQ
ncbi:MAG: hypothetical protein JNK82_22380 [Myxococcaceae bacterium]|nr:hypothetical protein [Myxococcaceae bacterium]